MFGLGVPELLIILVILLMIFGLGKLPTAAGQLGKSLRTFRDSVKGEDDEIDIGRAEDAEPAKLEDREAAQAARDATIPHQQETGERSTDSGAV